MTVITARSHPSKRQAFYTACLLGFLSLLLTGFSAQAAQPASQMASQQAAPQRVVSLNLCTDILALSFADGAAPMPQILSLSYIASDPVSSPVAEQAAAYPANHAGLEEVLALKPDLVLASIYTAPAKLAVLEQAGIAIERFDYAQNFADIRRQIVQMGQALGQPAKAAAQLQQFDADLTHLQNSAALHRQAMSAHAHTALIYEPNGFTSGAHTLADETLQLLGIRNLAKDTLKLDGGHIGLETLVQLHPDLLIIPHFYQAPALAYQNYSHPVMAALTTAQAKTTQQITVPMRYWSCGSRYTLEAAKLIQAALTNKADHHGH